MNRERFVTMSLRVLLLAVVRFFRASSDDRYLELKVHLVYIGRGNRGDEVTIEAGSAASLLGIY